MITFTMEAIYLLLVVCLCGCATTSSNLTRPFVVITDPPGATILVNKSERFISPASINVDTIADILISKESFWEEEMTVFSIPGELKEKKDSYIAYSRNFIDWRPCWSCSNTVERI